MIVSITQVWVYALTMMLAWFGFDQISGIPIAASIDRTTDAAILLIGITVIGVFNKRLDRSPEAAENETP